jgi:hypothetical protein
MAIVLSACGPKKGEVDPNATKEQEGDLEPPTCDTKGVKLRYPKHFLATSTEISAGTSDMRAVVHEDVEYPYGAHELQKGTNGGHALITFGDDDIGKLLLAYTDDQVTNGTPVAMRGYVKTDVVDVGNCEDPPVYVSKLTYLESFSDTGVQHGTFVLRQAHRDPYCSGDALEGTLAGCFRSQ